MGLIVALIIGGLIGWLGARLMGREEGLLGSVLIGIVGAIIGGILASVFGSSSHTYLSLTWSGVLWSLVGAVILSAILNGVQRGSTRGI